MTPKNTGARQNPTIKTTTMPMLYSSFDVKAVGIFVGSKNSDQKIHKCPNSKAPQGQNHKDP
jgi:hypothetical protein